MSNDAPATICYLELPAPDIVAAGRFYSSVFGWTITPSDLSERAYWEFSTGEGQLTGGLDPSIPVNSGGVILYLKVSDIVETLQNIRANGGAVVRDKFDIGGGYGFSAIFTDPNGNRLGLFSAR